MDETIFFNPVINSFFTSLFSQTVGNKIVLRQLLVNNSGIETILGDIDSYIGNKPSGLQYPVTKIVFSEFEDLLCYQVVAIDNSWEDLFKFGEVPYGYLIIYNRLFLVVKEGYHSFNLDDIFALTNQQKTFNKYNSLPSAGYHRKPTWFFEYRDNESYLISVTDLEVLD